MDKKITIHDIAKKAGVSITTVSRFLNKKYSFMSVRTRHKIEEVIVELNYSPNDVARTLKSGHSKLIGIVTHTLKNQVAAQTLTGMNERLKQEGYHSFICYSNNNLEEENAAIQDCLDRQVEGMIIIPASNDCAKYASICRKGIPVEISTRQLSDWSYGSVYVDHEKLIADMLHFLHQERFEKVLYLMDESNFQKNRRAALVNDFAVDHFNMPPLKAVQIVGYTLENVKDALLGFMKEYPDNKKVVFANNTDMLYRVLKTARKLKLRIPADIGVCGYDVLGWSELVEPGITSIYQPMYKVGETAAEQLLQAIHKQEMTRNKVVLNGTIHYRASTKLK